METIRKKNVLTGIMLTAGTAIGAGMFSLPIVSSGMWSLWSLFCLLFIWFLNYLGSLYVLEINTQFSPGASFDTLVQKTLGHFWNTITGLSIAFLLYILLYAYFSAFGSIAGHTLNIELAGNRWLQGALSLFAGGLLALIIWHSTSLVGKISTVLVFGMIGTFVASMSGLTLYVEVANIFDSGPKEARYAPYILAALPYFMTSFGFTTVVPSLYKFYGQDVGIIKRGLFIGSLLALLVYLTFIFICFGNISREAFIPINAAGGNMGTLIGALEQQEVSNWINTALNLFSNFAIITSFLGVGLGLFDYIADKFSFSNSAKDRFFTACICFVPPGLASFFFPNGFIQAIGYAGMVCVFGLFLVPALIIYKTRKLNAKTMYRVKGGNALLYFFFCSCLLVAVCQILAKLKILPVW